MKICLPVVNPEGLSSVIEADPAEARFLHFFDLEDHSFAEIDLSKHEGPVLDFDAVICSRINRQVFQALRQRGVDVFLSEAVTVQDALDEFRGGAMFRIPDEAGQSSGGCGGGCGGGCHGQDDHDHGAGGCHSDSAAGGHAGGGCGGGCGGHGESHQGSCCSGAGQDLAGATASRRLDASFRIAVTSQNRKTVTEHAGKCRKFWVYEIHAGEVAGKSLLELPLEQSLHEWDASGTHPLESVDVLITASVGDGMRGRLAAWGIETVVTDQSDPDAVVAAFLAAATN